MTALTEIPQGCSSKFPTPGVPVRVHPNHFAFVTSSSINEVARRAPRDFLVAQGRSEEFDALLKKARSQYRVALDKLADL